MSGTNEARNPFDQIDTARSPRPGGNTLPVHCKGNGCRAAGGPRRPPPCSVIIHDSHAERSKCPPKVKGLRQRDRHRFHRSKVHAARCLVCNTDMTNISAMTRLVIVGAGPIGAWVAEAALADGVVGSIVGVVDPEDTARRELVASTGAPGYPTTVQLPRAESGDVALVVFASAAEKVAPEIIRLVSAGYDVVTTCEGLAWAPRHLWDALHTSARSDGRRIIVTGANPGFAMDRLPLMLAGASRDVTSITVKRSMDTSTCRPSLVAKSGRGLTAEEFDEQLLAGRVGHKGLDSSARLIARGLQWSHKDVTLDIRPILEGGIVVGARHRARLSGGDGREIVLELTMAWDFEDAFDRITIVGTPPIVVDIPGGYPIDDGTAAHVVAAIRHCATLTPGFYRPTDLPLRFGAS